MSIDGPGILDSDLAHDVYHSTLDLYDAGCTPDQLQAHLADFERDYLHELDREIFLATVIKLRWEIGLPVDDLRTRLAQWVDSGKSRENWLAGGDQALATSRISALKRLLRQTEQARKAPRARKKHTQVRNKLFELGDCVMLDGESGVHLGVVCMIDEYRGRCEYAILVMHPDTPRSAEGFANGRYYGRTIPSTLHEAGVILGPHVICPEHRMLLREGNPFKKIGRLDLEPSRYHLGSFGGVLTMQDVIDDFARTVANKPAFGRQLMPLRELLISEPLDRN
ncbi:hypothetical protein G3N57_16990 [Paraburkholderia sp. Se-20369]|nr:hypothetical protein [Paraburkholderia sp. Se-20369]